MILYQRNTTRLIVLTMLLMLNIIFAQNIDKEKEYYDNLKTANMHFNEACVNSLSIIDVKNFDLAKSYYLKALDFKKNAPYPVRKIRRIEYIFDKYKSKMEKAYIRNIRDGERFIKHKKFSIAKAHFKNAIEIKSILGISPDNPGYPDGMLEKIDIMIREEKERVLYEGYLTLAEGMMQDQDFYQARNQLKKHIIQYPEDKKMNELLDKSNKNISTYEEALQKADQFYEKRQYDSSTVYYQKAYRIYPHDADENRLTDTENDSLVTKTAHVQLKEDFNYLDLLPGVSQFRKKRYISGTTYLASTAASVAWFISVRGLYNDAVDEKKGWYNAYPDDIAYVKTRIVRGRIDAQETKQYIAAAFFTGTLLVNALDATGHEAYIPGLYHFNHGRDTEGWILSGLFTGSTFLSMYALNDFYDRKGWNQNLNNVAPLKNISLAVLGSTIIYNIWDIWRSGYFYKSSAISQRSRGSARTPISGINKHGLPMLGLQYSW